MLGEGQQFAGYTVVRSLGAGGMGEVYLAQHPRLPRRRDALKLLGRGISADRNFRERFLREADLASTLSHQHIIGVHDLGEDAGRLWIAMDYIDGEDAAQLLRRRYPAGMPAELVAAIVTAVASALDYAHSKGLLHRDVKPANIMLSRADNPAQRQILLTDFGIARALDDVSDLTPTNTTLGTVAYSAPEQLMGQELDGRADQYSLAATAYQLLTGTTMFPASNAAVIIGHHLSAEPPPVSASRSELAALDAVLQAALAKKPQDRFTSCSAFARAFTEQSQAGVVAPSAPTAPAPVPPPGRAARPRQLSAEPIGKGDSRSRWLVPAAVAAICGVAVLALFGRDGDTSSSVSSSTISMPAPVPITSTSVATSTTNATSSTTNATTTNADPPVVLPSGPPPNSGCRGLIVAHHDLEHPTLGPMRIFLMDDPKKGIDAGCVSAVTASGAALPPIQVDSIVNSISKFTFAEPATDATGNTFIKFNSVRHSSVLVLVPTESGFADIGWKYGGHYQGRYSFHYASLSGPDADGRYAIIAYTQGCDPSCAEGTDSSKLLTWNGSDYTT